MELLSLMLPYVSIFNIEVPTYGLMAGVGIFFCFLFMFLITRIRKDIRLDDVAYVFVFAMAGLLVGAKIMGYLVELPNFVSASIEGGFKLHNVIVFFSTGTFVFYGGLLGSIAGCACGCKFFELDIGKHMNVCTPLIPLFHMFGRIGCFLTGCCYGIESQRFGIDYDNAVGGAPNGVPLLPVQLYEAGFELLLFVLTLILVISKKTNNSLLVYLLCYAPFRFTIEFLRGDEIRGRFLNLSTAQWVSIGIVVVCVTVLLRKKYIGDVSLQKQQKAVE
mgnify:FL=1